MSAAWTKLLIADILAELIDGTPAAGLLVGAKMGLFVNGVAITPNTVLADLTPASWTGYALSAAVTWTGPLNDGAGNKVIRTDLKAFTVTDNTDPQQVFGWYLVDTGGTILLAAKTLDAPITPIAGQVLGFVGETGIPGTLAA